MKEYSLTHSDLLAQYDNFHFYLLVALFVSAFVFVVIDPSQEDLIQTIGLVLPVLISLIPKYISWLYMGISKDTTFIYLFLSEDSYRVFRRALLLDILAIALVVSICVYRCVKGLPKSIFVCLLGMTGINFVKMWVYGQLPLSDIFYAITLFVLDCPGTLAALCVSGFVQFIIHLEAKKKAAVERARAESTNGTVPSKMRSSAKTQKT